MNGLSVEYQASVEQMVRQTVVYPRAERRAALAREVALILAERSGDGHGPAEWLGQRLINLGGRLARSGRPAPRLS